MTLFLLLINYTYLLLRMFLIDQVEQIEKEVLFSVKRFSINFLDITIIKFLFESCLDFTFNFLNALNESSFLVHFLKNKKKHDSNRF